LEVFWTGSLRSEYIYSLDREGNCRETFPRYDLYIQGMAYYPNDPDGFNLYILHTTDGFGSLMLHKMDTDYGDTAFVAILELEEDGYPVAATITDQFDQESWVFIDIASVSYNDRIDIWQIEKNVSIMKLEPAMGEIEANTQQDLNLSITTEDLMAGYIEEEIVFNHNSLGG